MQRRILVVDDNQINRRLLKKILESEYDVLEAANGKEALALLLSATESFSAVLLDLIMPEMNGYEVLDAIRSNHGMAQLPVIVTTGSTEEGAEIKALSLGANDYITKPYNAEIIRHRIWNTINLRETAAVVNSAKKDDLTGLYNRRTFFEIAAEMIAAHAPGYYVLACYDIDNFKVINDQYGSEKGDQILCYLASVFERGFTPVGGICSRITADNYALLYPCSFMSSPEIEQIRHAASVLDGSILPITFSIGRYIVSDLTLSVSAMYDRASIAKASIKRRFDCHIAHYDESMRLQLLREQKIISEMNQALAQKQFEVWFQPQYNHATGALIGAEALVRWRHPKQGLISPADFIPVFEKNGFIYELDKFIWEEVCIYQKNRMDAGLNVLPVSVNVSRVDIFREDLIAVISGLIQTYELPVHLLHLEITESAFAKSTDQIIQVVKQLVSLGFTIEIDDFGSGYSSLNTLKDVPAQVIKLDMRFTARSENSSRGGNILESVVRMSKWLDMSVIAEGVETIEQADFLKSIGCFYVQGYLYAKPMPAADYDALSAHAQTEEKRLVLETVDNMDNNTFWDPNSLDTLIFNSYIGGACVFEYCNGSIELLRANDKYAQVIGSTGMTLDAALALPWKDHLDSEHRAIVRQAIFQSIQTRDEVTREIVFLNLPGCPEKTYLRCSLRVIASSGERFLVYCTNENITAQREAEQKEHDISEQLQSIMKNINGGVTATVFRDGKPILLFANDQYFEQLGYTREQHTAEFEASMQMLHPDDRERVYEQATLASKNCQPCTIIYRIIQPNGGIRWIQSNISITAYPGITEPVQLAVVNDITAQRELEEAEHRASAQLQMIMDNVESGITASIVSEGPVRFLFANDKYYEMLGYTRRQYEAEVSDSFSIICPEDRSRVVEIVKEVSETGQSKSMEYRVRCRDKKEIWVRIVLSMTNFKDVDQPVQLCIIRDISSEKQTMTTLQAMVDGIPNGIGIYNYYSDGRLESVYLNEGYYSILGTTRTERQDYVGFTVLDAVHPDDIKVIQSALAGAIQANEITSADFRIMKNPQEYLWVNAKAKIAYRTSEKTSLYVSYANIDQEKRSLLQLEASKRILDFANREGRLTLWLFDIDKRRITHELQSDSMLGYPSILEPIPDVLLGNGTVAAEDEALFLAMYEKLFSGEEHCDCTVRIQNQKTGQYVWQHITYSRVHDSYYEGRIAIGISTDVDAQQRNRINYEHELQLRHEMVKDSVLSYELNLTAGLIEDYHSQQNTGPVPKPLTPIDETLYHSILKDVLPEDQTAIRNTLFVQPLLDAFHRGETTVELDYRRQIPGHGTLWVKTIAAMIKRPDSGDIIAFLYAKNIDLEKKSQLAFDSILDQDIESVSLINVQSGLCRLIKPCKNLNKPELYATYPYDKLLEKRINTLVISSDRPICREHFSLKHMVEQLKRNAKISLAFQVEGENGTIQRKRTLAYYLDDTQEDIVLSHRDITGLYEDEQLQKQKLQKAVDDANDANRAKSDFLSRMSHDMRTPLNAVIGMAALAKDEENPAKVQDYLEDIDTASHFLLGLINDILDLGKIESGQIELQEGSFTLEEFLRNLNTVIGPLMEAKNIEFLVDINRGPTNIHVDKLRFNQIFFNLLSNAAKYTAPGGRVEFTAAKIPNDENGRLGMRFFIRDTGRGMSEEFLKTVFLPFTQERLDPGSEVQGSGPGLAIVKTLIDTMGGTISVTSRLGEGTEFVVDLYAYQESEVDASDAARPNLNRLSGLHILLVEDNTMNVIVAKNLLVKKGCFVTVSGNGQSALERFMASAPGEYDAILMDIRMPVMNGLEATGRIRSLEREDAKTVPIIAMTADAFTDDKNKTLKVGMNAHITKPIDPQLMYETIVKLLPAEQ